MAGTLGGRRIAVPPRNTRPTSDRTREAVFNLLAARVEFAGSSVLDLYAGSGAIGLEALSRGVDTVEFVEADPRAAAVIDRNIASLDVDGAVVVRRKVAALLAAGTTRPFELVFADPPYDISAAEVDEMLMALSSRGWTTAGTVVVVERRVSSAAVTWPPGWSAWPTRRYGDTRIELAQAVG